MKNFLQTCLKCSFKKVLGYSILIAFFIGLYLVLANEYGFIPSLVILGISIGLASIIVGAVHLITS